MDVREKLELLGRAARYDDCVSTVGDVRPGVSASPIRPPEGFGLFAPEADRPAGPDVLPYVSHVVTPSGHRMAVLKVLQTSACRNDCRYCAFRAGRDFRRASFTPDELARACDLMLRAGLVQGMFLSSGIVDARSSTDTMLATAELLRERYRFRGYLHLKILPGAEVAQIARAVELADRVSVNLEAPNLFRLAALAPQKRMENILTSLRTAARFASEHRRMSRVGASHAASDGATFPESFQALNVSEQVSGSAAFGHARLGMSTQFVVGPAGESDRELLGAAERLYQEVRLARAYYSAFNPVAGTPLEGDPPTDPRREFRLYQADWLLRRYGFSMEELPFDDSGRLDLTADPKVLWAEAHSECFPVEVNRAALPDLLRVPGIGPRSARAIIAARRKGRLTEIGDLRRLGARVDRASPYLLLAGKRTPSQLSLW
jgi:predicted DNA-binding helix-hairpin-helix protein